MDRQKGEGNTSSSDSDTDCESVRCYFSERKWSGMVTSERKRYKRLKQNYGVLQALDFNPPIPLFMCSRGRLAAPSYSAAALGESEEEEEWRERRPPRPRRFRPPARRAAESQGAASTRSTPEAQPPTHTVARRTRSHTLTQESQNGAEPGTSQGGGAQTPAAAPTVAPSTSAVSEGQGQYTRGRNLRARAKVDYTEPEEPQDDHYFYCDECRSFFLEECEVHGFPCFIPDTRVVLGEPDRARLTLPPGLEVRRSKIPGAGLGVFNCGEVVPTGTHYGPYEGVMVEEEAAMESGYSWVIYKNKNCIKYIDAKMESNSNWMRYVNCARTEREQNLVAFQHREGILYRCFRPLAAGEELLVWYGEEYAKELGISFDRLWTNKSTTRGVVSESSQAQVFSCPECPYAFTCQIYQQKHIKRMHGDLYITLLRSGEIRPEVISSSSSRPLPSTTSTTLLSPAPPACRETKQTAFSCGQCGKSFTRGEGLRRHQRLHSGDKPFHCGQCGKTFNQSIHLRTHQRTHSGEKPFHCAQCGKSFSDGSQYRVHQRIHSGEKPFHCAQCGVSFTRGDHLRTHQRSHSGEKPFHCDQCGVSFTRGRDLRKHQRRLHTESAQTGEKPFHCDQCDKSYSEMSSLRKHQQRLHTESSNM